MRPHQPTPLSAAESAALKLFAREIRAFALSRLVLHWETCPALPETAGLADTQRDALAWAVVAWYVDRAPSYRGGPPETTAGEGSAHVLWQRVAADFPRAVHEARDEFGLLG